MGMYRMTGANGPCANLVDGQMHTTWNANRADQEQWVVFRFGARTEISGFRYYRNDNPEAPANCELQVQSGGSWSTVLSFRGTKGKAWSEDYKLDSTAVGDTFRLVVKDTHCDKSWIGFGSWKTQGANINQVQFHGKM